VTAYEDVDDHGLNQAAWEGLQKIEAQAQMSRLDHIESIDSRDWQKNILFFAEKDYDVVVTVGANLGEATKAVAAEYPAISFIGVDQEFEEAYENVATIGFHEEQAGFLAGMLAGMVSKAGKVGAVCETSGIEVVWQYCEGFRAGALYERDDLEVTVRYRESGQRDKTFNDPQWGKQELIRLADRGVDTITAFGGNTAQGAFLEANEKGIWLIGSEEDLYYRLTTVQPFLVTSITPDPGAALSSLILLAANGEAVSGAHTGEFRYAPLRLSQFGTDMEIKSNLENALRGIRSGEIEIKLLQKE
jgi:basic membrane protein A and related proteins